MAAIRSYSGFHYHRSDLINRIAAQFPQLQSKDAEEGVKAILDAIADALSKGDRAEIRGFGSFQLNHRPPRQGRNPLTGEKVSVPAKYVPHFRVGKELRDRLNASVAGISLK